MLKSSRSRATRAKSPRDSTPADTTAHDVIDDWADDRPTKRRKLAIRPGQQALDRQQTLDKFFNKGLVSDCLDVGHANGISSPLHELPPTANGANGRQSLQSRKSGHEGDQDNGSTVKEKRTLRSQDDGPRLKSELATYFSNYEEVMSDAKPKKSGVLDGNTKIYVTDEPLVKAEASPSKSKSAQSAGESTRAKLSIQKLDLTSMSKALPAVEDDPLSDDVFMVSHRRAERREKQMRNIEREHAMHEKVQLERLLDGLLGHDWLRVLGVTAVTDSEAKKFESQRQYFIREVRILITKFNQWKEDERRQRLEKEALLAAEREAEQADDEAEDDVTPTGTSTPHSSDLNASASRQLQQETASALRRLGAPKRKAPDLSTGQPAEASVPYRPLSPIKSFYSARHMRESALKRARNSRNQLAFGHLLPDMDEEEEFALPADYLNPEALRANARERRRRKRESVANPGTKI